MYTCMYNRCEIDTNVVFLVSSTHQQQFESRQQLSGIFVESGDREPVQARSGSVQRQSHHRLDLSAADELITTLGGKVGQRAVGGRVGQRAVGG